MKKSHIARAMVPLLILIFHNANAQSVSIKEELMSLDTYGYGKPNPVPILTENPKIFPYFKFEEYEHISTKKDWKVITLENDYIKVFVLPEIGGKVWGAIEKSTGEEFLYKNKVVKFRNIAMRGPWTSGGIEFNFGIIGHHPSTASPVDYFTRTNEDGSVSCIVGNIDLPSNTNWTVEIRLENDKAYFETNASWYNASPITQSYYNWMTAAAVATYDLEFFIPGNKYVEHNGNAHDWPMDEQGRNLSFYKNNTFGSSKSYHIVGEYNDFFGGYYHDRKFGFGQWAPYEEMPGQKLWLWDLSRGGGIWEDLLTDSDGQYIEFQAGRLFDQYSEGAINPISQVGFDPYTMDTWSEIWFPIKEIGGMEDASKHGILNVETTGDETYIGLNALQPLNQAFEIKLNGEKVFSERLDLKPMEVYSKTIATKASDKIEVSVQGTDLYYTNEPAHGHIKRPFYPDENLKVSESEQLYQTGLEAIEYRDFKKAYEYLSKLVQLDPSHRAGLVKLAELEYRKTDYLTALEHCNAVLRMDTYDSGANYMVGITYRALGDELNALESLGWAARDVKYRSVSYAQMAEIHLSLINIEKAEVYANKALVYNMDNVKAREVLLVVSRIKNDQAQFKSQAAKILKIDPLSHFVAFEAERMNNIDKLTLAHVQNEFKDETYLSVALKYHLLGLDNDALSVLEQGPKTPKNSIWAAYLQRNTASLKSLAILEGIQAEPVEFVFPYRRETLPILEWATALNNNWKLNYYLAQNYLAVGETDKGMTLLKALQNTPDSDVFYRFRASLLPQEDFAEKARDYQKALQLSKNDWKVWEETIQFYLKNNKYKEAYDLSLKASRTYKGNYNIELAHAQALLNTGRFKEVVKVMEKIKLLPYEHASESRNIYERSHLAVALELLNKKNYQEALSILLKSKEWPENIGVGKPYDPDERAQDYLLAISYGALNNMGKKTELLEHIVSYTKANINRPNINTLFGLLSLKKSGRQNELVALITELDNAPANDRNALVLALYRNDLTSAEVLFEKLGTPKDTQEILLKTLSF